MYVIKLGPLILNFELVIFILSSFVGYLTLRYRLSKSNMEISISYKFVYALILGFMIWKFSLIIFDPSSVIDYPLSLLYFNGGDKGLWLAVISSIAFVWIQARKERTSLWLNLDLLFTGLIAASSVYHLLLLTKDQSNILYHSLYAFVTVVLLIFLFTIKSAIGDPLVMNQQMKNWIASIAVMILAVWGIYDSFSNYLEKSNQEQSNSETNVGIRKGNKAPSFELLNLNEEPAKLSDFMGKKVILNFWATWCPPCRAEMPQMEKFHIDYEKDVVVLAINLTYTEKKESDVHDFVDDFGLTFPIVMDVNGDVSDTYKIIAYPTSYIIDSQGIIQEVFQGAINYEMMDKAISRIK